MNPISIVGLILIVGGFTIAYLGWLIVKKNKSKYSTICQSVKMDEVEDTIKYKSLTSQYHIMIGAFFIMMGLLLQFISNNIAMVISLLVFFVLMVYLKASVEEKIANLASDNTNKLKG
ncbi:hypothetical protein [Helicovermis profundi]|uniref:DUF3784 domain-containing protein n=1 Tax=Helicovermis profundi TaxID=3065157 RepID=A0AAU9EN08_9FIRM|nr:hypothetical protein HLPR_10020 [Clostridia bacterium S502]